MSITLVYEVLDENITSELDEKFENEINSTTNINTYFENDEFTEYSDSLLLFGTICASLLAIFGICGNFISILALSTAKHIRNATTAFIVNLCVADLFFSAFCMPVTAEVFMSRRWIPNDALCKFYAFVRFCCPMVSMFTILAITINRFTLIIFPNVYPFLYKRRNMAIMIAVIWLFPTILLLLPLAEVWGKLGHHPKSQTCTIFKAKGNSPKNFIYIIGLLVPSILFIICYTTIYIMVKKIENRSRRWEINDRIWFSCLRKRNELHTSPEVASENTKSSTYDKNKFRLVRVMVVIFTLFILCYFPLFYLKVFRKGRRSPFLNIFACICYFLSAVMNPFIYVAMSKEYRKSYKSLVFILNSLSHHS